MENPKIKKLTDYLIIAFFFLMIFLPLADNLIGIDQTEASDNRALATCPDIPKRFAALPDFFDKFDLYYRDRFGFRNFLIRTYNLLFLRVFGEAGNKQVIAGKNGWLYFGVDHSVEDYRKSDNLTPLELKSWKYLLEKRQKWLEDKGIKYLFVIVPNKETIYPEYMPDWLNQVGKDSLLDQLLDYLGQNTNIEVLDLRQPLLEEKRHKLIYYKSDTHWNASGAYVAYREIMNRLSKDDSTLKPYSREQFEFNYLTTKGRDLARMLSLTDLYTDEGYEVQLKEGPKLRTTFAQVRQSKFRDKKREDTKAFAVEQKNKALPKAVVFRDSFFVAMFPFFSNHFSRTVYYNQNEFDKYVVAHEKPQIVVQQIVERAIARLSKKYAKDYKRLEKMEQ